MGKKQGFRSQKQQLKDAPLKQIKSNEDAIYKELIKDHPAFQAYYRVFLEKLQCQQFIKTFLEDQVENIGANQQIKEENKQVTQEPIRVQRQQFSQNELELINLQCVEFYPQNLVWQLNLAREQLQKSQILEQLHQYIQRSGDVGLLSRQELVSMLPPLFLDIQKDDKVFDMCAAPGSQTAQLLEMLYAHEKPSLKNETQGFVVANDVDKQRACMLIHQLQRIPTASMMVLNHPAQFFPTIFQSEQDMDQKFDNKVYFDKVLADVPCSGDGATRKIPERWRSWHTNEAMILHPLQLAIASRAISMTKVGGLILFSTCSLNPIQDEAVVIEILRRASPGSLELVDIHNHYPGLKARRGLSNWKVVISRQYRQGFEKLKEERQKKDEDHFIFYDSYQDRENPEKTPRENFSKFMKRSMFPESQQVMTNTYKIQNTMRILPHEQNSGGFYLALFKKKSVVLWNNSWDQQSTEEDQLKEQIINEQFAHDEDLAELAALNEIPIQAEILQLESEGNKDLKGLQQNQNIEGEIIQQGKEANNQLIPEGENAGEEVEDEEDDESDEEEEQQGDNIQEIKIDQQTKVPSSKINNQILIEGEGVQQKRKSLGMFTGRDSFTPIDQVSYDRIVDYYGLQGIDNQQLVVSCNGEQKIRLVSTQIAQLLSYDQKNLFNQVNMGCLAFERTREAFAGELGGFRICQDSLHLIVPHVTKRKIKIGIEEFQFIFCRRNLKYDDLPFEGVKEDLKKVGVGSCVLYIHEMVQNQEGLPKELFDCFVIQNFKTSLTLMINKDTEESLKIRYC